LLNFKFYINKERKMKKLLVSIILISVLLVGLVGTVFASDGIIKIGAAVSLTGKIAYEGRLVKDGYEVWADWVNSHGGIDAGGKNKLHDKSVTLQITIIFVFPGLQTKRSNCDISLHNLIIRYVLRSHQMMSGPANTSLSNWVWWKKG
jgi:hypothetical protein